MIILQLLFLIYLLYTAERYLAMKISSKEHRLLPVIIVLAGLFNFYRVVECVTDADDVFLLLEQLLVFQVLYGVIHYKKDFLRIKFLPSCDLFLFLILVIADTVLVLSYGKRDTVFLYNIFAFLFIGVIFMMDVYIGRHIKLKKREKMIGYTIFFSLILVMITAIISSRLDGEWKAILTPMALFFVEIRLNRLMKSGYIVDTPYLLKEEMYDNSSIITVLFDEDGYLLEMNESAKNTLSQYISSDSKDKNYHEELVQLMKKNNEEIQLYDCFYRHHLVEVHYMGHNRGYILYLIDLTQEKQENLLMESLMQKAESATATKSHFLASMSHELRSPLHAIVGFCNILIRQSDMNQSYKKMLRNIQNAGDTLLRLVNAILDFSKMEAGKFTFP